MAPSPKLSGLDTRRRGGARVMWNGMAGWKGYPPSARGSTFPGEWWCFKMWWRLQLRTRSTQLFKPSPRDIHATSNTRIKYTFAHTHINIHKNILSFIPSCFPTFPQKNISDQRATISFNLLTNSPIPTTQRSAGRLIYPHRCALNAKRWTSVKQHTTHTFVGRCVPSSHPIRASTELNFLSRFSMVAYLHGAHTQASCCCLLGVAVLFKRLL